MFSFFQKSFPHTYYLWVGMSHTKEMVKPWPLGASDSRGSRNCMSMNRSDLIFEQIQKYSIHKLTLLTDSMLLGVACWSPSASGRITGSPTPLHGLASVATSIVSASVHTATHATVAIITSSSIPSTTCGCNTKCLRIQFAFSPPICSLGTTEDTHNTQQYRYNMNRNWLQTGYMRVKEKERKSKMNNFSQHSVPEMNNFSAHI